ncbi:DUF4339 domain-containing protein [Botrimarina mediterranea]|uniref:DUF4339 domain-containing protein n=1 Tax=Botrimarina mediterranea TaxID=2528022 RepID=UPI0011887FFE|nr:hypothetical protein K2D_34770 [Planctomycetes bacterium K2D]
MPALWYHRAGEQVVGPASTQQLRALVASGVVTPHTGLQQDNDGQRSQWVAAASIQGLFPTGTTGEAVCEHCGRSVGRHGCESCDPETARAAKAAAVEAMYQRQAAEGLANERTFARVMVNVLLVVAAIYGMVAVGGGLAMANQSGGEMGFAVFLSCATTGVLLVAAAVGLQTLLRIEAGRN